MSVSVEQEIADLTGVNLTAVRAVLGKLGVVVKDRVSRGGTVRLVALGEFGRVTRASKQVTGLVGGAALGTDGKLKRTVYNVPARRELVFRVGKAYKYV